MTTVKYGCRDQVADLNQSELHVQTCYRAQLKPTVLDYKMFLN